MSRRSAEPEFINAEGFVVGFQRRVLRAAPEVTGEVGTKLALCRHQVTGEVKCSVLKDTLTKAHARGRESLEIVGKEWERSSV
ncbi:MAG: hypothetical protein HGB26_05395 [Desulfobulbaceae bacterium]|nr:hypothetical protein [Desulfobulbaceae bacterium]